MISYVITLHEGRYHVILFWGGQPDYVGDVASLSTALDLAVSRHRWLGQITAAGAAVNRKPCPGFLWPVAEQVLCESQEVVG